MGFVPCQPFTRLTLNLYAFSVAIVKPPSITHSAFLAQVGFRNKVHLRYYTLFIVFTRCFVVEGILYSKQAGLNFVPACFLVVSSNQMFAISKVVQTKK